MSEVTHTIPPFTPYLYKAIYDWIVDQNGKPYITVLANYIEDPVLLQFARQDPMSDDLKFITLNIAPQAIGNIDFTDEEIIFSCRFSGKDHLCAISNDLIINMYDPDIPGVGHVLIDPRVAIDLRQRRAEAKGEAEPVKARPKLTVVK